MHHDAFELLALARAAGAVLAAVGHADALPDRGRENRFVRVDAERASAGLDRDLERTRWGLGAASCIGYPRALLVAKHTILPSNQNPLGALPARFRRERVLIVGCGDVGIRVARGAAGQGAAAGADLDARPDRDCCGRPESRRSPGNLDQPATLARLVGPGHAHRSPGAAARRRQRAMVARSAHWRLAAGLEAAQPAGFPRVRLDQRRVRRLRRRKGRRNAGRRARARRARSAASMRRGRCATTAARRTCGPASCASPASTRPTAKAARRANGCRRARAVLAAEDDVYTNHIHADDLARAVHRGPVARQAPARLQRQRRHRTEDGRLLRPGRRTSTACHARRGCRAPPPRTSCRLCC